MLATIWIHLGTNASKINDRLAVHFYSVAFLAFSKSRLPLKHCSSEVRMLIRISPKVSVAGIPGCE